MSEILKNELVNNVNVEVKEFFPTEKETIACLLSLLESLSYEVCSSDVWWLATDSAADRVVKDYGISKDVFNDVMERFEKVRKLKNKSNPMSSMF